ncbi:hypothetical protein CVIRNUC_008872 [Coccomyxa viridis]|uniref:DDT domain-containing protein n=1 Tax=Coccomyxa viridis TaxID=1274662 RepID=A0AAV1IG30_9CHLO|nr:hypothetical protein CVIRNUC_008872 [Coccomyxa viridis]
MRSAVPQYRHFGGMMMQDGERSQPAVYYGAAEPLQSYQNGGSLEQKETAHPAITTLSDDDREPRRGFEYQQPSTDFFSDDSQASDDSRPGHRRKRKREVEQERERPDTEMRQKLRHRSKDEQWPEPDANGISRSASAEFEPDPDAPAVLSRPVDQEQEKEERRVLQRSWEMAVVLDFLERFRPHLSLSRGFTVHELESVLILSPGGEGLLGSLHMDLMRGISTRSTITPATWAMYLAERLKQRWRMSGNGEYWPPPFHPRRNREAAEYAALPTMGRVQALKALCEIRLEKDDIVFLIEDAIKPCKATRQAAKQTGFWPSLDDFRREPMGEDSSGLAYYWFDLHLSPEGEGRLYRETPVALTKAKAPKGRGKAAPEPLEGPWELIGTTMEDMVEIGEKLQRSKKDQDRALATQILEGIVPELLRKKEEEEKRQRVAQRMQRQLNSIITDENGGYGRVRRQRKQIDYSGNAYDNMMRAAIMRQGRNQLEEGGHRRAALPEDRLSDADAAKLGMRRGRSAFSAEPIQWDAGLPLERRCRGAVSSKPSSAAVSGAASMEAPLLEPDQTEQSLQTVEPEPQSEEVGKPQAGPASSLQAEAQPPVQLNDDDVWTQIAPVKVESKPIVRFAPVPKVEETEEREEGENGCMQYSDLDDDEPLPKWQRHQARTVLY